MTKKIKGWLIYSKIGIKNGDKFLNTMKSKAKIYGIDIEIMKSSEFQIKIDNGIKIYYEDKLVEELPDFVFLRTMNISLGKQLSDLGVDIINNPDSMLIAKDKFRTHQILAKNNIPTPVTINTYNSNITYNYICKMLKSDTFIAKDNKGSRGRNVYLITNEDEFRLIKNKKDYIYQEYIKETRGKDLRVYVLGGKILGCVMRKSVKEDEFRANISVGGTSLEYKVDQDIKKIALEVAKIFDFEFTGIDLLFKDDKYTVCEVNSIAAFKSLNSIKNVTFSDEFYKYILHKYKN